MHTLISAVLNRPWTAVLAFFVMTVLLAIPTPNLNIEADMRAMLGLTHPARIQDAQVTERFAQPEFVMGIVSEEPTPEAPQTIPSDALQRVAAELASTLNQLDGLDPRRELSIESLKFNEDIADFVDMEAWYGGSLIRGPLVGQDGHSLAFLLALDGTISREAVSVSVQNAVSGYPLPPGFMVRLTGPPIVETALTEHILLDLLWTLPAVAGIVFILLRLGLGSLLATGLALSKTLVSVVWVFGLMALTDTPIYITTTLVPVLLISVGIVDEIHVFKAYDRALKRTPTLSPRGAMLQALDELLGPILITSATTATSFFAFLISDVQPIRDFGLFTGVGILLTLILSLFLAPAMWVLAGRRVQTDDTASSSGPMMRILNTVATPPRHLGRHIAVGSLLLIGSLALFPSLLIQDSWTDNFAEDDEIREAATFVAAHHAGIDRLLLQLDAHTPDAWLDPGSLDKLLQLETHLREDPHVAATFSPASFVAEVSRLTTGSATLPETPEAIAASYNALAPAAAKQTRQSQLSADGQYALLQLFLRDANFQVIETVLAQVNGEMHTLFGDNAPALTLAGDGYISQEIVRSVVSRQILSILAATLTIVLLLSALFRSARLAALAILPVVLTASVVLGAMALFQVPLGIASSMITAIVIGIGVDYSVHLIGAWRETGGRIDEGVQRAGPAIVINALVVGLGMLAMLVAETTPLRTLGVLMCAALLLSMVFTLWLVPLGLSRMASPEPKAGS